MPAGAAIGVALTALGPIIGGLIGRKNTQKQNDDVLQAQQNELQAQQNAIILQTLQNQQNDNDNSDNTTVILVAGFGFLILIIVIGLLLFFRQKK